MKDRKFPAPLEGSVETGPIQFGEDRPGIYLRAEHAQHYVRALEEILANHVRTNSLNDMIEWTNLRNLADELKGHIVSRREIFVFGSNLAGRHGAGAAKFAINNHGAKYGKGVGLQGNSYAIPTKDEQLKPLSLGIIESYVQRFLEFAEWHPELTFNVTKIGCGLAGYKESQIAPMFEAAPSNCHLPFGWEQTP